jgi:hypothetical protein
MTKYLTKSLLILSKDLVSQAIIVLHQLVIDRRLKVTSPRKIAIFTLPFCSVFSTKPIRPTKNLTRWDNHAIKSITEPKVRKLFSLVGNNRLSDGMRCQPRKIQSGLTFSSI